MDCESEKIRGVGKSRNGIYYLLNEPVEKTLHIIRKQTANTIQGNEKKTTMNDRNYSMIPSVIRDVSSSSKETLWHHKLGLAPMKRLAIIDLIWCEDWMPRCMYHMSFSIC